MRFSSLTTLLLLLCPLLAQAQAWTQPKGHGYFKVSYGQAGAGEQFDFAGDRIPYAEGVSGDAFQDRSVYLYGEYGVTDRLTVVTLLPRKRLTVHTANGDEQSTDGLGSAMLGLRWRSTQTTLSSLAINVAAVVPMGYARNRTPAIGPGQADVQANLAYGRSLYPLPGYAQASLGFRFRSEVYAFSRAIDCPTGTSTCQSDLQPSYDDEWLFAAEAGLSLDRWALLQVLTHGVWSNQPPETGFDPANPIPTRQRYFKAGLGVTLYPFPDVGLGVQYFTTPYGRNTVRSHDWFFGLEYKLR